MDNQYKVQIEQMKIEGPTREGGDFDAIWSYVWDSGAARGTLMTMNARQNRCMNRPVADKQGAAGDAGTLTRASGEQGQRISKRRLAHEQPQALQGRQHDGQALLGILTAGKVRFLPAMALANSVGVPTTALF